MSSAPGSLVGIVEVCIVCHVKDGTLEVFHNTLYVRFYHCHFLASSGGLSASDPEEEAGTGAVSVVGGECKHSLGHENEA